MEKIFINNNFLKSKHHDNNAGYESIRFYDDNYYYKIIKKKFLINDRQLVVEKLSELNNSHLALPIHELYYCKTFAGYSMKYYKNYMNIDEYLKNIKDFKERKELMLQLCEIFDYLDDIKYAYHDIHEDNILCKDGNIVLVDLDGGTFKGLYNGSYNYNSCIRIEKKLLSGFVLSKLLNMNENDWAMFKRRLMKNNTFYKYLPTNIKTLYEYANNNSYSVYYGLTNTIKDIDEDIMEETHYLALKK